MHTFLLTFIPLDLRRRLLRKTLACHVRFTDLIAFLILLSGAGAAWRLGKLTLAGAITGALLGILIYLAVSWGGLALMAAFFVVGTAATVHHREAKQAFEAPVEKKGRTAGQVLANGGIAGLVSLLALVQPSLIEKPLLWIAGSFSAAAADTLASELGTVYGRRFFDILSFRKGRRGDNGVVSWEGFGFGLLGSAFIAFLYVVFAGWSVDLIWILVGGTAGNIVDSLLGAIFERRGLLANDGVNLLNTATGAMVAALSLL